MSDKYGFFAELLGELNLENEVLPILFQNGFDEWDTVKEITKEILDQIGIKDEKTQIEILTGIKAADSYEEQDENEDQFDQEEQDKRTKEKNVNEKQDFEKGVQKVINKGGNFEQNFEQEIDLQKLKVQEELKLVGEKSIEIKDLLKATSYKKDPKQQTSDEEILQKITVLSLDGKKITQMSNINLCPGLQTLHLFQNFISAIDSLQGLKNLRTLHLESNLIYKIQGLESLYQLEKLYLNNNRISRLEGMQNCVSLKELKIANQNIQGEFTFEEESLIVIGETLVYLDCSNSRIQQVRFFENFQKLEVLKIQRNQIENFETFLEPLSNMKSLIELDLRENPITKISKYRDRFVLMSRSIEQLDEKKILPKERQFLLALWKKKHGMTDKKEKTGLQGEENQNNSNKITTKNIQLQKVDGVGIKNAINYQDDFKNPKNYQKLNSGGDFRSNTINVSTKHVHNPNSKKPF